MSQSFHSRGRVRRVGARVVEAHAAHARVTVSPGVDRADRVDAVAPLVVGQALQVAQRFIPEAPEPLEELEVGQLRQLGLRLRVAQVRVGVGRAHFQPRQLQLGPAAQRGRSQDLPLGADGELIPAVGLLVEEGAALEPEALVEAPVEVAVEARDLDPDVPQQLGGGPCVRGRRVDRLRAAVADQRPRAASVAVRV